MEFWYFIYMCLNKYFGIVALEKSSYLEEKKNSGSGLLPFAKL